MIPAAKTCFSAKNMLLRMKMEGVWVDLHQLAFLYGKVGEGMKFICKTEQATLKQRWLDNDIRTDNINMFCLEEYKI